LYEYSYRPLAKLSDSRQVVDPDILEIAV
jgi:hypothetical protein